MKEIKFSKGRYFITKEGSVYKRLYHGKLKELCKNSKSRYKLVNIDGKLYYLHRLVLETFNPIDNMQNLQVNHRDCNKHNNNINNLEWCTASENMKHAYNNLYKNNIRSIIFKDKFNFKIKLNKTNKKEYLYYMNKKKNKTIVCFMKNKVIKFKTQKECGKYFNVSYQRIRNILHEPAKRGFNTINLNNVIIIYSKNISKETYKIWNKIKYF